MAEFLTSHKEKSVLMEAFNELDNDGDGYLKD